MVIDYFPSGIATGEAFLGREEEANHLLKNIKKNRHTLLLSPRRYGKTSLVKHVLDKANLLFEEVDLFLATDEKSIEKKILNGITNLIASTSNTPEQWFKELLKYFRKANKKWSVAIKGFKLELEPDNHQDVSDNILDGLKALHMILKKKKQKGVIFIDEIQEISQAKSAKAIEGAIRNFAQESKNITFIFTGSNQHRLRHMFSDKNRPLYALCDKIELNRISSLVYKVYLDKVAEKTWRKLLSEDVFNKIIELTECHPRILYVFCDKLWDKFDSKKNPPKLKDVNTTWEEYLSVHHKEVRTLLSSLSSGQIKVLTLISLEKTNELTGKLAQRALDMSSSAITQALQVLEEKSYIERIENKRQRIIDPTISAILKIHNAEAINSPPSN